MRNYRVCAASCHDHMETEHVLTELPKEARGEPAWLDGGYTGMEDVVGAKHMTPKICEKGRTVHPLTEERMERNLQKSMVGACLRISGADDGRHNIQRQNEIGAVARRKHDVIGAEPKGAVRAAVANLCRTYERHRMLSAPIWRRAAFYYSGWYRPSPVNGCGSGR